MYPPARVPRKDSGVPELFYPEFVEANALSLCRSLARPLAFIVEAMRVSADTFSLLPGAVVFIPVSYTHLTLPTKA